MASNIDVTKPEQGLATTSSVRENFLAAKTEIESLQANGIEALTTAEVDQLENIGTTTLSGAQWAFLGAMDQGVASTDSPTFVNVIVTTINSVTAPTAQYTTAEETKLAGIEALADVTDTTNVLAALAGQALAVDTIELENVDTTLSRASAGDINIEGNIVYRAGGTDVPVTDGGTGASDAATAFSNIKQAATTSATGVVEQSTSAENLVGTATTTPTVAGVVEIATQLDATPAADHTANGPQTNTLNAGYTNALMDLVYLNASGKWLEADADATGTSINMLGIALEVSSDTNPLQVALPGSFVRDDTWTWTIGVPLYVSGTLGDITETAPSGSGDVVRAVGFAVTAEVIWFQPSPDYITVA